MFVSVSIFVPIKMFFFLIYKYKKQNFKFAEYLHTFNFFLNKILLSAHHEALNSEPNWKVSWFYTQYIRRKKYLKIPLHFS
jgi:hypothetical protein